MCMLCLYNSIKHLLQATTDGGFVDWVDTASISSSCIILKLSVENEIL